VFYLPADELEQKKGGGRNHVQFPDVLCLKIRCQLEHEMDCFFLFLFLFLFIFLFLYLYGVQYREDFAISSSYP